MNTENKLVPQKKSWWKKLLEKIDKAMVEKSKKASSCCDPKSKGGKCC